MIISGEREWGRDKIGVGDQEVQTSVYKINKLQGYIVQHRKYSQYFTITLNAVYYTKILSLCCTPETNIIN